MDDWDIDESPASGTSTPPAAAAAAPAPKAPVVARSRWQDEDKSDEEEDDWDVSDSEKPKKTTTAPTGTAAPPKKKKTLKQKLAEKERLAAEPKSGEDEIIETLTEQDRRRIAREKELESDMMAAAELMGGATIADDAGETLKTVISAKPTTKADFATLSQQIMSTIIAPHVSHPLYSAFVEQLSKDLCEGLTAVQTRKVSSGLGVLGNTKQQEERDKASGKKKTTGKPKLAAVKNATNRADTEAYDDVLDDDDFM